MLHIFDVILFYFQFEEDENRESKRPREERDRNGRDRERERRRDSTRVMVFFDIMTIVLLQDSERMRRHLTEEATKPRQDEPKNFAVNEDSIRYSF